MAETIILPDGARIVVDTNNSWEGFRIGDLIIYLGASTGAELYGKKVRIRAITVEGKLYVEEERGGRTYLARFQRNHCENPGIILLERPSYGFKVGDKVKSIAGNVGVVLVLNPNDFIPSAFLVEFVSDIPDGHSASAWWHEPWYPRSYKTDSKRRLWMQKHQLTLFEGEYKLADDIQKQPITDEYSGQREITRKIFAELEARLAKGEFPVFEPRDLKVVDGVLVEVNSSRQVRNLRECLRLFGAALFHLVNNESEFDVECYIVDPDLAYRKKMPAGNFGALIEELLFGEKKENEIIRDCHSGLDPES